MILPLTTGFIADAAIDPDLELIPLPPPVHIQHTAHHEAGHAVVGVHFGRRVRRVVVRQNGSGCVSFDTLPLRRAHFHAESIVISMAGWIAEDRFARSIRAGRVELCCEQLSGDRQNMAERFRFGRLDLQATWPRLVSATQAIVEDTWPAVSALAETLAERRWMSGAEVHALLRRRGL